MKRFDKQHRGCQLKLMLNPTPQNILFYRRIHQMYLRTNLKTFSPRCLSAFSLKLYDTQTTTLQIKSPARVLVWVFSAICEEINGTTASFWHSQWLEKHLRYRSVNRSLTQGVMWDVGCESVPWSTDLLRCPADSVFQPLSRKPNLDLLLAELRLRRQAHDLRHRGIRKPATQKRVFDCEVFFELSC